MALNTFPQKAHKKQLWKNALTAPEKQEYGSILTRKRQISG